MKIAFDVKGTLHGPHEVRVKRLFNAFKELGCEMYVWSSVGSWAYNAVTELELEAIPLLKYSKSDALEQDDIIMDIAIDDDSLSTYLATKKLILVHTIPDDVEGFAKQLIG